MNNKGKTNTVVIFVIIAIAVLAMFLVFGGGKDFLPAKGEITNGWWNEATEECWSASDRPAGVPYPIEEAQSTMFQCCFDQQGYQIDCNDPSIKLGQKQIGAPFALYGEVAPGIAGYFSVAHTITISNTGNIDLSKVWIESATWTPAHTELTTAYSQVIGSGSTYAIALPIGQATDFPTSAIDLQEIGTEAGQSYSLSLMSKASATGLPDASKTTPATMYVKKETIGFSFDINIGA